MNFENNTNSRLFLKPSQENILISRHVPELFGHLSIRSLNLNTDIEMIYEWVNKAYTKRFWQLNNSKAIVNKTYEAVLDNPQTHSFIVMLDEKPVCQIDAYALVADELAEHIDHQPNDCGMHLLMCPPREMQKGWSIYSLRLFQQYYFSFTEALRLFAEPDQDNYTANQLAMNAGFKFWKTIDLSYKTANLYCINRRDFKPF